MKNQIICGDCLNILDTLKTESVDLVCTSPPYAEQRKRQYGGIPEAEYPAWTVQWMQKVRRILKPHGSVAIVIRPHIRNGQISDYVLRTRLQVRASGWIEAEELVWVKPDSPPMGSKDRPRRAWESILWFSKTRKPFCDPKANGNRSNRIGLVSKKGVGDYKAGVSVAKVGVARCRDYVEVGTGMADKSDFNTHPATYPVALCEWILNLLCPPEGTVLDPFMGSGSTAVACVKTNRTYIGIEKSEEYCDIALQRVHDQPSLLLSA